MELSRNITVIPARKRVGNTAAVGQRPKLKVAAYCRVSTDSEEQASSYEVQVAHYTQFIQKNPEWELAGIYADDGITGTNTKKREEFNRMIQDCMDGNIDMIITKSISRFARNTRDLLDLVEHLTEKQVEFVSRKEAIDTTTPTGKFMLTVFAAVAELEREYILQRQREGIAIARTQGKYRGRPAKDYPNFECVVARWRNGEITAVQAMK